MTRKQAHTLMALGVALILMQILCTLLILRGQERARRAVEAVQASSEGSFTSCPPELQPPAATSSSVTVTEDNEAVESKATEPAQADSADAAPPPEPKIIITLPDSK